MKVINIFLKLFTFVSVAMFIIFGIGYLIMMPFWQLGDKGIYEACVAVISGALLVFYGVLTGSSLLREKRKTAHYFVYLVIGIPLCIYISYRVIEGKNGTNYDPFEELLFLLAILAVNSGWIMSLIEFGTKRKIEQDAVHNSGSSATYM